MIGEKQRFVEELIMLDIERHGEPNVKRIQELLKNPPKPKPREDTLHKMLDEFIKYKEVDPNTSPRRVVTLKQMVKSFKACSEPTLLYEEFTSSDIMRFETHLRTSLNASTVNKRIIDLKVFFNYAASELLLKPNQHIKKYRVKKYEPDFVVLDEYQLKAFLQHVPMQENQKKIKDCFIVLLFTGMSFTDYTNLRSLHIVENQIVKNRQKSDTIFSVPIHHRVEKIIRKYETIENLPKITSQHFNRQLQQILKEIPEFRVPTELKVDFNKYDTKSMYEWVTSHTGRHTCIDRSLRKRVPINLIMSWVGHKKIDMLISYAKKKD